MMVAQIKPLAGPTCIPSMEMEGPELQVGRVMVHGVPQGSSIGCALSGREHGRTSCCEKTKRGFDGDLMPKLDSSYPFLVQPIR